MKVTDISANSFWKGEVRIQGQVEDREKVFHAKIYLKSSQVFDYSCSCVEGNSYRGMCGHCRALLEEYRKTERENSLSPVSTSQSVRAMIREYTNREVERIMGEEQVEKVNLVPRLLIGRREVRLECRIGRGRLYQIKDLAAFAGAVEEGKYVEYGKGLAFCHTLSAFAESSRPLVRLVTETAGAFRQYHSQTRAAAFCAPPALRALTLNKACCDRLFEICRDGVIEAEDPWGRLRSLSVREENPSFEIPVAREGKDGICVGIPGELLAFMGEHSLYVADSGNLCRCDGACTEALAIFLEKAFGMTENPVPGCDYKVLVNEKDIPLFYERVLRKLELLGYLKEDGVNLEQYRPSPLKAVFFFDSAGPDQVSLKPTLSYGECSFHPLEDENLPRSICRDVPGEFRVSQLITRYFKYREDGSQNLLIKDSPDELYRLLDEGIGEFRAAGEVRLSETFRKLKVVPPPGVSVGVTVSGGLLELTVDTGDLSGAELARVLAGYTRKKKYYRMKSGEFLKLGDDGLLTVAKLAEELAIPKSEMQSKRILLPAYRALYLDSLMKESGRIYFHRDQAYRSLVRGLKSVEDAGFEIPREVDGVLREYQKTGYRWLKTLDACGFGGILADDMGLGKTLQMISVLADCYGGEAGSLKEGGGEENCGKSGRRPSLVICPSSLIYNWCHELETFAPSLRVTAMAGSAQERKELAKQMESCDVVVTSYDLLKRDLEMYLAHTFRYEVIDEAQYIKNASTQSAAAVKSVHAVTRFALTGTPVENRLSELWSIFDYLMPGFLFGYRKFRERFELPIVRDGSGEALASLRRMIGPFVLRRLKRDVLKELPEKLERTVYSALEGRQRTLYMGTALKLKEMLKESSGPAAGGEKLRILGELMRLRQLCCDPSLCYDNYDGGSAKLETCVELISGAVQAGHKVLLFSQFASMLEILKKRLRREKIACHLFTGSTPKEERNRLVQSFKRDDVPVFLISLKAGGTGLNLTAADIVIHYDPWWNVAAQNQATDRAHRIGQDRRVTVYKLIMQQTIEENILRLQDSKKYLADQIVTEGTVSLAGLGREELLEILGV